MGDLFAYLLSGCKACEYTNASTSQMLNPNTRTWDNGLIEKLGLPRHLLLDPVLPGTVLGPVRADIAELTGVNSNVPVIATASHDTASAVAAVPVTSGPARVRVTDFGGSDVPLRLVVPVQPGKHWDNK